MALGLARCRKVNFPGRQRVTFTRGMHDYPIADLQVRTGGCSLAQSMGRAPGGCLRFSKSTGSQKFKVQSLPHSMTGKART
jgi:hypothetical protein